MKYKIINYKLKLKMKYYKGISILENYIINY